MNKLLQLMVDSALRRQRKKIRHDADFRVKAYLERIVRYFDAEKAGKRCMTVVYEIHDSKDNNGVWTISIANGKCELSEGEPENFDTKLYMTAEVYERIVTGRLEFGRLAYLTGAVRYYGNSLGHRELNSYLSIPKDAGVAAL